MSSSSISISYHISCSFILSLLLIFSPVYSILFYFISNWFYSILFYLIWLNLYYSVSYLISLNDLCLSVRLSVCVFICMNRFLFSLRFFSLSFLFSHERLPRTHIYGHMHGHTHTYEYDIGILLYTILLWVASWR